METKEQQIKRIKTLIDLYNNPEDFSQLCRKIANPLDYYKLQDFHKDYIRIAHNNPKSMIIAPRGFLKSSVTTVDYTLYHILFSKLIQSKVFIVADSQKKYREFLREIAAILKSQVIQDLFGEFEVDAVENKIVIPKHPFNFAGEVFVDAARATVMGFTVDQAATGMHLSGRDMIVLDDAFVSSTTTSKVMQDARKHKIYAGWLSLIAPGTKILCSGTRYTRDDEYEILPSKGYVTNPASRSAIKKDGTALWEDEFPLDVLYDIRDNRTGSIQFALQFLNDVAATEGLLFKPELLESIIEEAPKKPRYRCYGVDAAFGGADSTAVARAEVADNKIYISLELSRNFKEGEVSTKYNTIVALTKNYPTFIENNGTMKELPEHLKQAGHNQAYGYNPGRESKGMRAQALLAAMERGQVKLVLSSSRQLYNEFIRFTGDDTVHDDCVDAAVIAWHNAKKMITTNINGTRFNSVTNNRKQHKKTFTL